MVDRSALDRMNAGMADWEGSVPEYARPDYDPTSPQAIRKYSGIDVAAPSASPAGRWWQRHGIIPQLLQGDAPRTMSADEQAFRNRVLADSLAMDEQRQKAAQNYQRLHETTSELRNMPRVTGSTYFEPMTDEELAQRESGDVARAQEIINRRYPTAVSENGGASPVTPAARSILRQKLGLPVQGSLTSSDVPATTQAPNATAPATIATVTPGSQNPYALAGYEASDQDVSAPIPGGAPPSVSNSAAPAPAQASTPSATPSIPVPFRRPAEFSKPASEAGNQSLFGSILERLKPQDPYAGMSAKQMYEKAQDVQRSGDESGANLLIQRAGQMPDAGMKRGGTAGAGGQKAAGPHKDAALHKALDIIHTMLQRGR